MRTTVDIPEDLHKQLQVLARDTSQSLSATAVDLIRRGLAVHSEPVDVAWSPVTGLPVVNVGRVVTSEDVRSLDEDE